MATTLCRPAVRAAPLYALLPPPYNCAPLENSSWAAAAGCALRAVGCGQGVITMITLVLIAPAERPDELLRGDDVHVGNCKAVVLAVRVAVRL